MQIYLHRRLSFCPYFRSTFMAKAFLFDLNGTMIDDMEYHIRAWHRILTELGADLTLERVKKECYGKNDELLERIFPGRYLPEEKKRMGFEKEKQYQREFLPRLRLLPGLDEFMIKASSAGIKMAIGSAAIMYNIDFVIDNLNIRHYFDAVVSADDVMLSKPDPETFMTCAEKLGIAPADCIVFEDSPKGVESARRAGMKAVVITTLHEAAEFEELDNVIFTVPDFRDLKLLEII